MPCSSPCGCSPRRETRPAWTLSSHACLPAANERLQGAIVPLRYAVHVQAWGGRDAIVAAHSASPDAPEANYNLALLEASDGELEAAFGGFSGWSEPELRRRWPKAMLGLFATLGETDPLVKTWRRKLAMALF